MISPNEIRKGNLILLDTGIAPPSIHIIKGQDIADLENGKITLSALSGIPLTPEWLERCGFQFLDSIINGRYYVKWANSPSEIAWYPVGEYVNINTSTGGEGEQPNYTELQMPHIKHVHQLQNLYFALTGCELNVKL